MLARPLLADALRGEPQGQPGNVLAGAAVTFTGLCDEIFCVALSWERTSVKVAAEPLLMRSVLRIFS